MVTVDAIRRITIQTSTPGAPQATQSLNDLVAAQNRVAASANQLRASMDASQKMLADHVSKLNDLKTANDNASGGFSGLAKNASDVSHNLASTVESTLSTISHLKLLAVAAYAMSPAFRAVTNSGVTQALSLMPPVMAQAATGAMALGSRLLAMTAPLTIPVASAVIAWKALNYVWSTGSDLLEKYGGQVRSFFGSNVTDDLAKLTRFQPDDGISQQQIQYATELGARLTEAKKTLSDFWTQTIDVKDQALKLQAAWVSVVEAMAAGITQVNKLLDLIGQIPNALGALGMVANAIMGAVNPVIALINGVNNLAGNGAASGSDTDPMATARKTLAAGMGGRGNFYKRFTQGVADLKAASEGTYKYDTTNPNQTDAYQRAIQNIKDQITVLQLEADAQGKTSQAVEEAKVTHQGLSAAMRAGIPVTQAMKDQWKAYGDQIADLTIKVNQAKVAQEEMFKQKTMFMSPSDAAAAAAAKQIDPTNWQAHMGDLGPQIAAMNAQLTQARDLADGFANSFGQAMLQGKTAAQALNTALNALASSLISMISKQLVNQALGGLMGMFNGSHIPSSGIVGQTVASAQGNVFDRGMIHPFALGGIVSDIVVRPTLFPMANGAGLMGEAGPEAVMPLTRMSGGQLGVKAAAGGSGGTPVVNNIYIENNTNATVTQTQQPNSTGGTDTRITFDAMANNSLGRGALDKTMKARYGIAPTTQQR
jgi:lambda family phage tail tape measure protein